jgi:hypothetical protein
MKYTLKSFERSIAFESEITNATALVILEGGGDGGVRPSAVVHGRDVWAGPVELSPGYNTVANGRAQRIAAAPGQCLVELRAGNERSFSRYLLVEGCSAEGAGQIAEDYCSGKCT